MIVIDEKLGVKGSIFRHIVRLRDLLENVRSELVREQILNHIAELRREADLISNGR